MAFIRLIVLAGLICAANAAGDCSGRCTYWWNGCKTGETQTAHDCQKDYLTCCTTNSGTGTGTVTTQKPDTGTGSTGDGSCGVVKNSADGWRIVGGFEAKKGQFPWQVQVQRGGGHWCGGALINDQWLVSAAHCFYGMGSTSNFKFVLGQHDKSVKESSEQVFSASRIINHESYGNGGYRHDIAMIKLNGKAKFNDYVVKACLPKKGESFLNLKCTVSGWGALREGGGGPRRLNAVTVPIMTLDACRRHYGSQIYDTNVCAGYEQGGKDACQGDSGGPLACKKFNEPWKITGVVSWGIGCARQGQAGVYTDVASYIDWINRTVANN